MKKNNLLLLALCYILSHIAFAQSKVITDETITANDGVTKTYFIVKSLTIKPPNATTSVIYTGSASNAYVFKLANPDATHFAPSNDQNFVRTESILVQGITLETQISTLPVEQKKTVYQYADGLGRNVQTLTNQGSPTKKDIVAPVAYDNYGRQLVEYMPFTIANDVTGKFRSAGVGDQDVFYKNAPAGVSGDTRPFKENVFEASPLNRITDSYGSGLAWKDGTVTKGVKSISKVNLAAENIIQWKYFLGSLPERNGTYAANQLMVQESTDEESQITKVYTDSRGLTILSRVGDGTTWFDTYNIYYPSGLIAMVIQPEGVARLATEFDAVGADKQSFVDRWCFLYKYDDEQRLIAKRVPGWKSTFWFSIVYDKWNRIVYDQNPAQQERNEWTYYKYDRFNRAILNGLSILAGSSQSSLQSDVNTFYTTNPTSRFETELNNSTGYTLNISYPRTATESSLIVITYYDSYIFQPYTSWDAEGTAANYDYVNISGFPQKLADANLSEIMTSVKGYATGSKTRVLGTTRWLNSISYYDKKYRIAQIISENYVGGRDRITTQFDFVGRATKGQRLHTSSSTSFTALQEFEYDHAGRLKNLFQTTDSGPRVLMAANTYNEIGQLIEKNIHSTDNGANFLQSIDMRYNIRGWLTSINNSTLTNDGSLNNDATDLFGMELLYNPASQPSISGYPSAGSVVPKLYNGNITAIKWKADTKQGTPEERIYGFEYDVLSRLKQAYYATNNVGAWTGNPALFNEQITSYDKNGNIKGISRNGKVNGAQATIDNLTHTYTLSGKESNRLISVSDASNNAIGFKDGATATEEFKYDASGNLNFDLNKQISSITYNHLNLPQVIEFTRTGGQIDRIEYTYDATGVKLRTLVRINGQQVAKTDYVGDIQYDNDQLTFASTPEGRVLKNGAGYDYEYFLKDHQGNVRVTYGSFKETVSYRATMENPSTAYSQKEESEFINIANRRYANAGSESFNYTKSSEAVLAPDKSAQTNTFLNKTIGPAKRLRLLSGDKVHMETFAKYSQVTGSTATATVNALVAALATTTFGFNPGETGFNSFNANAPVIPGIGGASSTLPKAYLAYVFLNDSDQFVGSSAISISTSAYNAFEKLERNFTASQSGYLYVYVTNETNTSTGSVYFDEMQIVHQKNNNALQVTQASDYYPFGLSFNTYQAERMNDNYAATQKNRYGFQGQEWQKDLDLGWSQFKWRNHQPDIGRFFNVDPLSDDYVYNSPYAFSENHVTSHVELEGLEKLSIKNIDNSNGTIQGPWKDQATAQAYARSRPTKDGFIISSTMHQDRVESLEKGNFNGTPEAIVLHRTVNNSTDETITSFNNRGLGTHFIVGADGVVTQTASLNKWTQHVGKPSEGNPGKRSSNSVGIEVVGNYNYETKQWDSLTEKQVMSVSNLVNTLYNLFGLAYSDVYNHEDLSAKTAGEGQVVKEAVESCINNCNDEN